jgi:uncharacterized membrane protein (DUF373 family)
MKITDEKQFTVSIRLMEWLERWGYITAGVSFLFLGMIVFIYGWYVFYGAMGDGVLGASLVLMNDLLLVIILLELFRTVLNFLKTHTISLEPFLYVGIVAAIRKILTTGAQETVLGATSDQHFNRYIWDIGLHGLLILALVLAIFTYRQHFNHKP